MRSAQSSAAPSPPRRTITCWAWCRAWSTSRGASGVVPGTKAIDDYFIEKKLYPNVDFYSGVILNAIGFPTDMFTALFALARTVGWVAQWNEMISDPEQKIGRPRQLYVGEPQRDYVPVDKRG